MNLTLYAANALLNGTAMPATLYVQMHTGDPGVACTSNVSTAGTRKSFTRATATVGTTTPSSPVDFNPIGVTETITHLSIWDAASSGNPWWAGEYDTPDSVNPSDFVRAALVFAIQYWGE